MNPTSPNPASSHSPRVSIIMLSYQRPERIGQAIASIVSQSFPAWELIVVQDGKNPSTIAQMAEWTARDARIIHLRRDQGGNIADATNYGLARARGQYIAILDDDDTWASDDKLAMQVEFMDKHTDHAGCGGGAMVVDGEGRERSRYLKPEHDAGIKRVALRANPMIHGTGLYRRALIEQLGRYDVSLAGFQDWDVWLKLGGAGKLYNFPLYLLNYTIWDGGGSFTHQRRNTESGLRIVWRHRRHYPGFLLAWLMMFAYYLYSYLPLGLRKLTFGALSRLKKAVFAQPRTT